MSPRPWESDVPFAELLSSLSGTKRESGDWEKRRRKTNEQGRVGFGKTSPSAHSAGQQAEAGQDLTAAIRRFLDENPILALIQGRAGESVFRRVAGTNGGEWAGACPLCGGHDRLRIWPTPREGHGGAWCRQCNASGDALAWATRLAGRDPKIAGTTSDTLRQHGLLGSSRAKSAGQPVSKLNNSTWAATLPDWARELYEERAAIQEFDGGLARPDAERQARVATEVALEASRG